jgi:hypothetical protein
MPESPVTSSHLFDWKRFRETDQYLETLVSEALGGNPFADRLAVRMRLETGTRFVNWIDHLLLSDRAGLSAELERLGYTRDWPVAYGWNRPVYRHEGGRFPRIVVESGGGPAVREVALKVDSVAEFSRAHDLGLDEHGYALGPYRVGRVPGSVSLAVVERRGYRGFEPLDGELARTGRLAPHCTRDALAAYDLWHGRRRRFDDDAAGFEDLYARLERVIELCHGSTDLACHLVLEAERVYWQSRNRAAQAQKARQDRLGLGWANAHHHAFRCSRTFVQRALQLFQTLGFSLGARFHAGESAGWGAQILDHPVTGITVFAELELAPEERGIDFTGVPLADVPHADPVGLWVGLHGESLLEAGMHRLGARFDFDAIRSQPEREAGICTMPPSTDLPFLDKALAEGERWQVDARRLDRMRAAGWIDAGQHGRFLAEGAIGSQLENLEPHEGSERLNLNSV